MNFATFSCYFNALALNVELSIFGKAIGEPDMAFFAHAN